MDQPVKTFNSDGGTHAGGLDESSLLSSSGGTLGPDRFCHEQCGRALAGRCHGPIFGLPTSFTQRPYNYPELFVSVFEFCIAGLVAAVLNYFFQRPSARRVKRSKGSVPTVTPGPIRVVPQAATSSALTETAPPQFGITPAASPMASPAQEVRMYPVIPSILVRPLQKPRLHRLSRRQR